MKFVNISGSCSGTTPGLRWVSLEDGRVGVLKRDTDHGHDYDRELCSGFVFECFGMKASRCVQIDADSFVSLQSYNKRFRKIKSAEITELHCLEEYKKLLPAHVWDQVATIAFVDAVCGQTDRHAGNLDFLVNDAGSIVAVCPPFDNVNSFGKWDGDECLLAPDTAKIWYADTVCNWLSANWCNFEKHWSYYCSDEFIEDCKSLKFIEFIKSRRNWLMQAVRAPSGSGCFDAMKLD